MKSMRLEAFEVIYNEKHHEIRLLTRSVDFHATLFTLNETNLETFIETICWSEASEAVLVAQPMRGTYAQAMGNMHNDDLSEFFKGEVQTMTLLMSAAQCQMIESEIWELDQFKGIAG